MDQVFQHERELLEYALERLSQIERLELYGPEGADRLGIIAFNVKDVHPDDVALVLNSHGIAIRSGHHCTQPLMRRLGIPHAARASFYIYNTKEEIDQLAVALEEAGRAFRGLSRSK